MYKHLLSALTACLLLCSLAAVAQTRQVTGKVTDAKTHAPLPGVAVAVQGTTTGAITNDKGDFTLAAPAEATTLVISDVGYTTRTVPIGTGPMTVALQMNNAALNEVVVIGYGSQRRKDLTGSIAKVDAKDFQKGAITSPDQLIAGKISGVTVTSNSGQPGAGSTIRIRGLASLNGNNDPLIVVDGVPLSNNTISGVSNPLDLINPNDIASVTVLKDAASAAIYGSRASSGVILITTKQGEAGKPKFDLSSQVSVSKIERKVNVLSPKQFRDYVNTYGDAAHKAVMGSANIDWQDEIYQSALTSNSNLSVSGGLQGSFKMPYRISVGYLSQQGILKTDKLQRTSASLRLSPVLLNDHLKIDLNLNGTLSKSRFANHDAIGDALSFDPTQSIYEKGSQYGGYFEWQQGSGSSLAPNPNAPRNPIAALMQKHDLGQANRSFGNIVLDYSLPFLPALHISWNGGYDASKGWGTVHWPADAAGQWSTTTNHGFNSRYLSKTLNTVSEVTLKFNKDIASIKSNINAVAGYGYYNYKTTNYSYPNLDAKGDTIAGSAPIHPYDIPENTLISYYGRLIYTFHDKYILMGSLRTDGSSRFAPAYRWGVFPAASLAWRINEEPFLKNSRTLSDLKLRVSYGVTGNQAGIADYQYLPDYYLSQSSSQYQLGDKFYSMYTPAAYTANLKWEQTASTDVGVDYGFLNGRISGSIDYYYKKTSNLLDNINIAEGTNFTNILLTNIGNMTSKGAEFSINAIPVQNGNLTWSLSFNMAYNKSTITKLRSFGNATFAGDATGNISGATGQTIQIESVGYNPMAFYVYKQIYDPKTGMPIEGLYEDQNRDGVVNSDDKYRYKSPLPIFTYGFSTSLNYRKWTFSTVLRANVGNYVYNNVGASLGVQRTIINPVGILVNATTDIYNTGFINNEYQSDYYIQNASFLKMDNIGVDYQVLSNNDLTLSVALHCQNVFTVTKYTGLDPEVYNGLDNNLYPRPRVFTLGANLGF